MRLRSKDVGEFALVPESDGLFYSLISNEAGVNNSFVLRHASLHNVSSELMSNLMPSKCSYNHVYSVGNGFYDGIVGIYEFQRDNTFSNCHTFRITDEIGEPHCVIRNRFMLSESDDGIIAFDISTRTHELIRDSSFSNFDTYSYFSYLHLNDNNFIVIYEKDEQLMQKTLIFPFEINEDDMDSDEDDNACYIIRVCNHPIYKDLIVTMNKVYFIICKHNGTPYIDTDSIQFGFDCCKIRFVFFQNNIFYFFGVDGNIFAYELNTSKFIYDASMRSIMYTNICCIRNTILSIDDEGSVDSLNIVNNSDSLASIQKHSALCKQTFCDLPMLHSKGCSLCFSFWEKCVYLFTGSEQFSDNRSKSNCVLFKIRSTHFIRSNGSIIEVVDICSGNVLHSFDMMCSNWKFGDANHNGAIVASVSGTFTQNRKLFNECSRISLTDNIAYTYSDDMGLFVQTIDEPSCRFLENNYLSDIVANPFNSSMVFIRGYDSRFIVWDSVNNNVKNFIFNCDSDESIFFININHFVHKGRVYCINEDGIDDLNWFMPFLRTWEDNLFFVIGICDICIVQKHICNFEVSYKRYQLNVEDQTFVEKRFCLSLLEFLDEAQIIHHNGFDSMM
ncbi:hypothetical protein PCE1_002795 [Barthelona sp. PCE]